MTTAEDVTAIQSIIGRWSHLLDDKNFEAMSQLLLPDAIMEFPSGQEFHGRDVIRDGVAAVQPELPVKHLTGIPDIEIVTDDIALARTDMVGITVQADGSLKVAGMSRYFDRLHRADGTWKFHARRMRSAGAPPVTYDV